MPLQICKYRCKYCFKTVVIFSVFKLHLQYTWLEGYLWWVSTIVRDMILHQCAWPHVCDANCFWQLLLEMIMSYRALAYSNRANFNFVCPSDSSEQLKVGCGEAYFITIFIFSGTLLKAVSYTPVTSFFSFHKPNWVCSYVIRYIKH